MPTSLTRLEAFNLHQQVEDFCFLNVDKEKLAHWADTEYYGLPDSVDQKIPENSIQAILQVPNVGRGLRDLKSAFNRNESLNISNLILRKCKVKIENLNLEQKIDPIPDLIRPSKKDLEFKKLNFEKWNEDPVRDRIAEFVNTVWWYYKRDSNAKVGQIPRLIRMVLKFNALSTDGSGDVEGELIAAQPSKIKTFNNYLVRILTKKSSEAILVCELKTKSKGKNKRLLLRIDSDGRNLLSIGQEIGYTYSYSPITSNVIIEKPHKELTEFYPSIFLYNSKEIDEIDPAIQEFFQVKSLNVLKAPNEIFSYFDLRKWLEKKRAFRDIYYPPIIHDLYVAYPYEALQDAVEKYQSLESELLKMIKDPLLKKMGFENIYLCPIPKTSLDPNSFLRSQIGEIRASRSYLLIFPQQEPILTSALTIAGCSIYSGKPTFIVYKDRNCLPSILRGAGKLDNIFMNSSYTDLDISGIPEWLYDNKYFQSLE